MRKIFTTATLVILTLVLFAQAPEKMSYQAVIRDSDNNLVVETEVGMQISILQGSTTETAVYTETQTPTTNANGLVSIEIGTGTSSDDFSTIDWATGTYFIKTETDPTGGTSYTITGINQLLSVPYALYAKSAGNVNETGEHYIGELYGGGIIFYLYKDNSNEVHGLIASIEDLSDGIVWSNVTDSSGASSQWNGITNSNKIVAQTGHTESAAKLCLDYTKDGYDDWYLPSLDELFLLTNARFIINSVLANDGDNNTYGFNVKHYCSSTETVSGGAVMSTEWGYGYGTIGDNSKSSLYYVRAVRQF